MQTASYVTRNDRSLKALVERLAAGYEARSGEARTAIHETHISVVLLAGERAYKFKKPVNLGFVDFSTLERRRHFCERELVLNRRFAPGLYLGVVPVTETGGEPGIGGDGPVVEYAVAMRRFHDDERLDRALEAGRLETADFERLGRDLAGWHDAAEPASPRDGFGSWEHVLAQTEGAFEGLGDDAAVRTLERDLTGAMGERRARLARRLEAGRVRDCHGDLHLSNLVLQDGRAVPFDCLEFDDALRIVDTASDAAFVLMDLDVRGHGTQANVLLNAYLDAGGDFDGVPLLAPFCAYRSVVRAKVAALQSDGERRDRHLALAGAYLEPSPDKPALVITHGYSGSGKTHFARALARRRGYVHLRSDAERRRLAGLPAPRSGSDAPGEGLYAAAPRRAAYDHLGALARELLGAGWGVIVDATFLERAAREQFRRIALEAGGRFTIAHCDAPAEVLHERVRTRLARGDDASEATPAVLERQMETGDPLSPAEAELSLTVPTDGLAGLDARVVDALGSGRPGAA